jgi:hypothetical protein
MEDRVQCFADRTLRMDDIANLMKAASRIAAGEHDDVSPDVLEGLMLSGGWRDRASFMERLIERGAGFAIVESEAYWQAATLTSRLVWYCRLPEAERLALLAREGRRAMEEHVKRTLALLAELEEG